MAWPLQDLSCRQIPYQRAVRFKEVQVEQFLPLDPPDFAKDPVLDLALVLLHFEELQFHRPSAWVLVTDAHHFIADGRLDTELFLQFPPQGIAGLFPFLDLAAREFPFERHYLMARPLACEDTAIVHNKSSDYPLHEYSKNRGIGYLWPVS